MTALSLFGFGGAGSPVARAAAPQQPMSAGYQPAPQGNSLQSLLPGFDITRASDPGYMAQFRNPALGYGGTGADGYYVDSGAPTYVIKGSDGQMYDIGTNGNSINLTSHYGSGNGGGGTYNEYGLGGNLLNSRQFQNDPNGMRDFIGMGAMMLGPLAAGGAFGGAATAGADSGGAAVSGMDMAADTPGALGSYGGAAAGAGGTTPYTFNAAADSQAAYSGMEGAGVDAGMNGAQTALQSGMGMPEVAPTLAVPPSTAPWYQQAWDYGKNLFPGASGPGSSMNGTGGGGVNWLQAGAAGAGIANSLFGPKPPSASDLISAQQQANLGSATANAELNRINQTSPWGSVSYSITGHNPDGTPIYTQNTALSPTQQQLFDLGQKGQINSANIGLGMQGQLASTYGSPMDTSSLPGLRSSAYTDGQTMAGAIQNAQDAAYHDQTQYLDPQFAQQDESLRQQLANQGLDPNSQAYKNAMLNQAQTKQRAYQSAQNAAVTAGQNEQNTLFGQGVTSANLQNQSNQLGMQNLFSLRAQPLNEYNGLMTGTQVSSPNFTGFQPVAMPTINTMDLQKGLYGVNMANNNATTAGLFSLAGAAMKSSGA